MRCSFTSTPRGETINPKSNAIYAMVKDFRQRGVPIDGVGLQVHLFDLKADGKSIEENLLASPRWVCRCTSRKWTWRFPPRRTAVLSRAEDLRKQAQIYGAIAQACLAHPGCTAIQTWGFTGKYSWIRSKTKGAKGAALLFDRSYLEKPACGAVKGQLKESGKGSKGP